MKKNKLLAAAMASVALTGMLQSCDFNPDENVEPDVYGPPTPYEEPEQEPDLPEEYDPSENVNVDVYGPPEAFE